MGDFIIENGVLTKYVGIGGDVVIPEGIRIIGEQAFYKQKKITSVIMPTSATVLERECFAECRNLKEIQLSNNIVAIGENAFSFCVNLEKLKVPEKVVSEEFDLSINDCWNLKELILPLGITVKEDAYWYEGGWLCLNGCNKLTTLVCPSIPVKNLGEKRRFAGAMGFVQYREKYENIEIVNSYIEYILKHKKLFLEEFFKNDIIGGLQLLAENNKITIKNFESEYLNPALSNEATSCVMFLIDWKNKYILTETWEKQQARVLNKDPYNVTDMKKLWGYESLEDGSLAITNYKGTETKISIPERIGRKQVSTIAEGAFYPFKRGRAKKQTEILKRITAIEIPESVTTIEREAFYFCDMLNVLIIPKGVKIIEQDAFSYCGNLSIRVFAGSYAEEYAKKYNIPYIVQN